LRSFGFISWLLARLSLRPRGYHNRSGKHDYPSRHADDLLVAAAPHRNGLAGGGRSFHFYLAPAKPRSTAAARRWLAPAGLTGEALSAGLTGDDGPLAAARLATYALRAVTLNVKTVRWPSAVRPDLGGHAEYLLRSFRVDPERGLTPGPLENTPDVARIQRDPALRGEFLGMFTRGRQRGRRPVRAGPRAARGQRPPRSRRDGGAPRVRVPRRLRPQRRRLPRRHVRDHVRRRRGERARRMRPDPDAGVEGHPPGD
jgi:hypothetical protein